MKNVLYILLMVIMMIPSSIMAKKVDKQKFMQEWSTYEVTTVAVGSAGTKSLKVWGYGKNMAKAIEQAKKNAVHACLFRGCPGSGNVNETPAIFKLQGNDQVALENFEYFYDFFEENNTYISFVNLTTDGMPSGQDRHEVKGGYKVAIYVQIMFDNLRDKMKNDGILKDSQAGFSY